MFKVFFQFIIFSLVVVTVNASNISVRIKDIVNIEGVRENQLVGYGLVVGLNGTGDNNSAYTTESLVSMLERMGVNVRDANISASNVAAVMVTASLPAFARHGSYVDVNVSAMGSAKDLKGGTLLVTPLMGADGEVYAVAQGPIAVGGFKATGAATTVTKGVPTSGRISNGGIVEKEIGFNLNSLEKIHLSLKNPDFTTSQRVSQAINTHYGQTLANATDPTTIVLNFPGAFTNNKSKMLTEIEQLTVIPDQPAKVVIDDHDGVIVMGENVRILPVAVSHGSITIKVTETPQVSQPNPFTQVTTATEVDRTDIKINEKEGKVAYMQSGVSLQELVNGLNTLGATPRDLITILQSIKAAGALQADIQIM